MRPRLAWAAAASLAAHAAVFVAPGTTRPGATHPVSALLVRTIVATGDRLPSLETSAAAALAETPAPPAREEARSRGEREGSADARPPASARSGVHAPAATAVPDAARTEVAPGRGRSAAAMPQGPVYHVAGELDPPPRPLQDIEPEYPPEAGYQPGTVVLRLFIDETGSVDRVDVLRGTPPGLFENAARTAFAAAHFSPGRIAGIAVKCQLTIEVEFTPINRGSEVSGRTY
jgi:TonB family protein